MVADRVHPLGMSVEYLEDTPVDDYLWPGLFLIGLAVAALASAVGLVLHWQWTWAAPIESAVGFRWPWIGAVATGAVLLVFEVLEIFLIPFHPVMHPLLIAVSLAIIGLSMASSVREEMRSA